MSVEGTYLGSVSVGDKFSFLIHPASGTYNSNARFDVWRDAVQLVTPHNPLVADQSLIFFGYGGELLYASVDTSISGFVVGERYTVVLKGSTGSTPSVWEVVGWFEVVTDVAGRLDYLKNNQDQVILPRLKRLLISRGENVLIDKVTVDQANNMTGMRVRFFDSKANATAATPNLSDLSGYEPGEIERLDVTQTYDLPLSVRNTHKSIVRDEAADSTAPPAPGNTGGWPG